MFIGHRVRRKTLLQRRETFQFKGQDLRSDSKWVWFVEDSRTFFSRTFSGSSVLELLSTRNCWSSRISVGVRIWPRRRSMKTKCTRPGNSLWQLKNSSLQSNTEDSTLTSSWLYFVGLWLRWTKTSLVSVRWFSVAVFESSVTCRIHFSDVAFRLHWHRPSALQPLVLCRCRCHYDEHIHPNRRTNNEKHRWSNDSYRLNDAEYPDHWRERNSGSKVRANQSSSLTFDVYRRICCWSWWLICAVFVLWPMFPRGQRLNGRRARTTRKRVSQGLESDELLTYRRTAALLSTALTNGFSLLYWKSPWLVLESRWRMSSYKFEQTALFSH